MRLPATRISFDRTTAAAAVWLGTVDDLWKLGKPRGEGGPWKETAVRAGEPSDPYLFTGYDRKSLTLRHDATEPVKIRIEVDVSGTGLWLPMREFTVPPSRTFEQSFPMHLAPTGCALPPTAIAGPRPG